LTSGPVEAAWSLRREREFEFCPFGYYLRYYGAKGGHDAATAPKPVRRLYLLCDILGRGAYLQRVLNFSMRELFYAPEDEKPETLFRVARRRLRAELKSMFVGESGIGPHLPMLAEILDPALRPDPLRDALELELEARCAALEAGDWPRVLAVPAAHRRRYPAPLEVRAAGVKCHAPALLMWLRSGVLNVVEGVRKVPEGEAAELASLLHRCHALDVPGADVTRIRSLAFDEAGALTEFGPPRSVTRSLRRIRAGAEKLRRAVETAELTPRRENCSRCVFRTVCSV